MARRSQHPGPRPHQTPPFFHTLSFRAIRPCCASRGRRPRVTYPQFLRAFAASLPLAVIACGGSSSSSGGSASPTGPSPTPVQANRAPVITAMNFAPAFGIAQLTQFSFNASASDPDGDPITYTWEVGGNTFTGTSDRAVFPGGFIGSARLTVADSKGLTATDTRDVVVGSATGAWRGTWGGWIFTSTLTQTGSAVSGDYSDQLGPGRLDPASANTIDANGNVRLRYKQAIFSDFTFTGTMDATGRRMTGVVNGSGASNVPFTMTK